MAEGKREIVKIYFDGSCHNGRRRGGKTYTEVDKSNSYMGIGVVAVVRDKVHKEILISGGIGTNNIAEWMGAVAAITLAKEYYDTYHDCDVRIFSDSELIVNQYNGSYKIKQKEFRQFYDLAKATAKELLPVHIRLSWIPREQNKLADNASKRANPYFQNKEKEKQKNFVDNKN